MQKEESKGRFLWNIAFFVIAAVIITADQLTKNWIRGYTGEQPIFKAGIFRIIIVENTGASFGMFQGQNFVLTIVAVLGIVFILAVAALLTWRFPRVDAWLPKIALGLILGGTAGNLMDRLNQGYVTDFIDIGPWPTFNVADSSMVVGVILLVCYVLFSKRVRDAFPSE